MKVKFYAKVIHKNLSRFRFQSRRSFFGFDKTFQFSAFPKPCEQLTVAFALEETSYSQGTFFPAYQPHYTHPLPTVPGNWEKRYSIYGRIYAFEDRQTAC